MRVASLDFGIDLETEFFEVETLDPLSFLETWLEWSHQGLGNHHLAGEASPKEASFFSRS